MKPWVVSLLEREVVGEYFLRKLRGRSFISKGGLFTENLEFTLSIVILTESD